MRIAVDHASRDLTNDAGLKRATFGKGDPTGILQKPVVRKKLLPAMLAEAERLAREQMTRIADEGATAMNRQLAEEIERLEDLAQVNPHVTPQEIESLKARRLELATAIAASRLRLDALRVIFRRA